MTKCNQQTFKCRVVGQILSTRPHIDDRSHEPTLKMLVQVGQATLFGTVPAKVRGEGASLVGRTITFTAHLRPERPDFGYFVRPSNAVLS
jgi:hypothetical protein